MDKNVWLHGLGQGLASLGVLVLGSLAVVVLVMGQVVVAAGTAVVALSLAWWAARDATRW